MIEGWTKFPVLKGYVRNHQLFVWCPFCKVWHIHGAGEKDEMAQGHRCAHCTRNSPLKETGYLIAPFSWKELFLLAEYANDVLDERFVNQLRRQRQMCYARFKVGK